MGERYITNVEFNTLLTVNAFTFGICYKSELPQLVGLTLPTCGSCHQPYLISKSTKSHAVSITKRTG